jgi:hypothetical protein
MKGLEWMELDEHQWTKGVGWMELDERRWKKGVEWTKLDKLDKCQMEVDRC